MFVRGWSWALWLLLHCTLTVHTTTARPHSKTKRTGALVSNIQAGIKDLRDQGCLGHVHNIINDAFHPYSALRDEADKEVRVFFDAEAWLPSLWSNKCMFAGDHWDWQQPDNHILVDGNYKIASDRERRFNGYVMTCPDPGVNYTRLIFTVYASTDSCGLKSVPIQSVKVEEQDTVGACMAVLFSTVPSYEHWLENAFNIGISHLNAYFTNVRDRMQIDGFYGIHGDEFTPFQPIPNPAVSYFHFNAPIHRYYFGQSTLFNECIYRNRRTHKYIMISDADELLHDRHPGAGLFSRVDTLMPPDSASIAVDLILFFYDCPENSDPGSIDKPFAETLTHFPENGLRVQPGKTIVAPRRVNVYMIHNVHEAADGFLTMTYVSMKEMYFKHLRPAPDCENLVDERDASAFEEVVDAFYAKEPL